MMMLWLRAYVMNDVSSMNEEECMKILWNYDANVCPSMFSLWRNQCLSMMSHDVYEVCMIKDEWAMLMFYVLKHVMMNPWSPCKVHVMYDFHDAIMPCMIS